MFRLFLCIRRKLSGKSKKWRSIFNLGRSVDSKGKLNRNGSVFIRASGLTGKEEELHISKVYGETDDFYFTFTAEKAALRPSRSMESLCSLPTGVVKTYMHDFNMALLSSCYQPLLPVEGQAHGFCKAPRNKYKRCFINKVDLI